MMSLSRPARVLVSIAVISLLAMVLAYALHPGGPRALAFLSDVCWTWAAAFAPFCCFFTARTLTNVEQRRTWRWIGIGCAAFFLGQLYWTIYDMRVGAAPPYPSPADIGFIAIYPCLIVGIMTLVRGQPARRAEPELLLDTVLVTFTVGALTYEYLLEPLLLGAAPASTAGLVASVGWSIGAVAVLWMILIQMMRRPLFPPFTAALVLLGVFALEAGNAIYAVVALRGTFHPGGALDLTWDAGLLLLAGAAAIAPDDARHVERGAATSGASVMGRAMTLVIGLVGMAMLAVIALLRAEPQADDALILGVGFTIVTARVLYSLGSDRRYAHMLEEEVANQTRSLMSSLGATASAERNLRLVMEAVPDAITVVDRDGWVLDENSSGRALVRAFPADDAEAGGNDRRPAFGWLNAVGTRIARENLSAAFEGELRRFEVPFQRPDGSDGSGQVLLAPVREGGRIPKVLMLVRDITEQRRAQTQLQQAEKLAAMGQLVSGVAHEINNPAAIISGFAQTLLLEQLSPDQRETVQMMYDEATRIGRITSNLLAFARAGSKERTLVDLNEIVRRTYALRSYHLTTLNITVKLELDESSPRTWANGSEMQQMLLNLLINAEQALMEVAEHREITLRTRTAGAGGDWVQLEVADTGPGIPPEIREKIFDPFFTTKPEGTGTGLGLSICYGIVHDHGGRIAVSSAPGQGAVFTIEMQRDARTHQRITPAPMTVPAEARAATRTLSVLLIDDEESLRRAVLSFLKRRGIHAVGVGDGADGLRALEREDFDVIVSDVRMPGMSGGEFLDRLRQDHPALVSKLVFTTGDTFAPDTSTLLRDSGVPSLVKPYDFAKLERTLWDVARADGEGDGRATKSAV
ncbi:MAG TPA: ATP-binding protein [Gemmatimonadales bacterium]|jgi:signal transduction histidine kinase/ActR/RegA family two-component response regulator